MKKKFLIIFGLILILLIILFIPYIKTLVNAEGPTSPYANFGTFTPYTAGYFPENFTITSTGTTALHETDIDQFEEWYGSENFFIQIIQSSGERVEIERTEFTASMSRLIQDQVADLKILQDPNSLLNQEFDLNNYERDQVWLLTFFIDEIRIQVLSNLPENELINIAENLAPSICLNPTKGAS